MVALAFHSQHLLCHSGLWLCTLRKFLMSRWILNKQFGENVETFYIVSNFILVGSRGSLFVRVECAFRSIHPKPSPILSIEWKVGQKQRPCLSREKVKKKKKPHLISVAITRILTTQQLKKKKFLTRLEDVPDVQKTEFFTAQLYRAAIWARVSSPANLWVLTILETEKRFYFLYKMMWKTLIYLH